MTTWGGYRAGAGRKKRQADTSAQVDAFGVSSKRSGARRPAASAELDPLDVLREVAADPKAPAAERRRAALTLLQYEKPKPGSMTKRQQVDQLAEKDRKSKDEWQRRSAEILARYGHKPQE